MRIGADGKAVSERVRVRTPRPATPKAVLGALEPLVAAQTPFDRVAVGFPGVVVDGVVKTAPNLHGPWPGFDLAAALREWTGKPVRVLNDAGLHGYAAIEGRGVEVCITLGTGMGFSLFTDGHYVPNVELGHHPFHAKKTYEDWVGGPALARVSRKAWSARVGKVIAQLQATFNCRKLYVGGGNAKKLALRLPRNVERIPSTAALFGGARLWAMEEPPIQKRRR
jgi:polyphosphate glucokinase